jgi:hypothetical protein
MKIAKEDEADGVFFKNISFAFSSAQWAPPPTVVSSF